MKKLVALIAVLAISSVAGASLSLGIGGKAFTEITVAPSDTVTLQIISQGEFWNIDLFIIGAGPSTISAKDAVVIGNYNPGTLGVVDYTGADGLEAYDWVLYADMSVPWDAWPTIRDGVVVDGITLHCEGPGDVIITLVDLVSSIQYGTFVIHQADVPEPMTLGLLGVGGLFLRRRISYRMEEK